ncbi:Methyltransferase domain-containing protein [Desulfacinum hydrothermale DSM 13146]|uniref:Methyltransferase domain-containing protein n=1 Tax=Desulfacinum hydrothermale DSM 13146 TaxID=1121390 RepID=A0A1W1XG19_9BACT|nr:class I SAM-dependent methyltransferase [Desulfacinum hydrothermale]SMC22451.1 Methyltransferase domain-containing protein [Desulfacinum hydrothermale DSM 13146]
MATGLRQPHAVLDLPSRMKKALKIERLLGLEASHVPMKVLEIGTGSGGIAYYFATHPVLRCDVTAVDVVDQRLVREGFQFHLVNGTTLPFEADSFDVVISNHVIEHVGDRRAQRHHIQEMARVLSPRGIAYLAVPNRWMVVEPHFRLAFLSWLPDSWRSAYVRLRGRGEAYDCAPMTLGELDALLAESGMTWRHVEVEAFREMLSNEGKDGFLATVAALLPDAFLSRLRPIIPTLVCILRKEGKKANEGNAHP